MTKPVPSPCISVCYINDDGFCQGCFRTGEEIANWMSYSEEDKAAVVNVSEQRRKDSGWVL